eukprot:TRINITY_DN10993_c0_g1_i2.p3 TRINITY_DN10993_c0_g1~~TRINITY_DN10993_c0_g1_i2.p3  ORF type:complete len:102 (+),score=10.90 TRINITY_DN10993_c0_g1_i2:34-306(+)
MQQAVLELVRSVQDRPHETNSMHGFVRFKSGCSTTGKAAPLRGGDKAQRFSPVPKQSKASLRCRDWTSPAELGHVGSAPHLVQCFPIKAG